MGLSFLVSSGAAVCRDCLHNAAGPGTLHTLKALLAAAELQKKKHFSHSQTLAVAFSCPVKTALSLFNQPHGVQSPPPQQNTHTRITLLECRHAPGLKLQHPQGPLSLQSAFCLCGHQRAAPVWAFRAPAPVSRPPDRLHASRDRAITHARSRPIPGAGGSARSRDRCGEAEPCRWSVTRRLQRGQKYSCWP